MAGPRHFEETVPDSAGSTPRGLRRYAKLVAGTTLFLVFAGAMVTSTGSGLAVPDWPLSYGMLFPPMVGGIFYEHGHRMIASAVGLMTVILAFWLQRREPKLFVRRLGWAAVAVVIVQGLLGGLTVIFLLPPAISVSHAALAEIFLCMTAAIAFFTSTFFESLQQRRPLLSGRVAGLSSVLLVAVFIQILLGALMRHLGAGLAIPDFPLSQGALIPSFTSLGVVVNYSHRVGALMVIAILFLTTARILSDKGSRPLRTLACALLLLCSVQVALGAFTVWSGKHALITSLHVMTGALLLATSLLVCLAARALKQSEHQIPVARFDREATA